MKIEVIRPFLLGPNKPQKKGATLDVDDILARELIATGKAVRAVEKPARAKPAPAPAVAPAEKEPQNA